MRASSVRVAAALTLLGATLSFTPSAGAQQPPPTPPPAATPPPGYTPPPPGYAPPPPGYAPPPPGYAPPPSTTYIITQPGAPPPAYYGQPDPAGRLGPRTLDYEEGDPIPTGYHKRTKIRTGLVVGGSVMFGVTYLTTIFVAGIGQLINDIPPEGTKDFGPLLIPFVGPFIGIGTTKPSTGGTFGLSMLGVLQTGGLAMFICGLALPRTVLVRDDIGKPSLTVTPTFGVNSGGLSLTGAF